MARSKSNNKITGNLGETVAATYLERQGYRIVARNYWRLYSEIDIIARDPTDTVHFIEVKTVSYETKEALRMALSRETWRPEEQVHQFKLHQIAKAVETWVAEQQYTGHWQIDVMAIRVVPREKYATVKFISNVID